MKWRDLRSGLEARTLPDRVQLAIREQQDRSEILIGWFQLGVVLVFGALYGIAPKTYAADAPFHPVPWVLTIYVGLTLIRLVWAARTRLPDLFLALSVVLDMSLLMGLIWSFHLQYGQPASFFLNSPILLYVFIFIALRALRFQASFVVLSGLVSASGWALMVFYVLFVDPERATLTHDYVTHLTTNSVLLGAEVDKFLRF